MIVFKKSCCFKLRGKHLLHKHCDLFLSNRSQKYKTFIRKNTDEFINKKTLKRQTTEHTTGESTDPVCNVTPVAVSCHVYLRIVHAGAFVINMNHSIKRYMLICFRFR